MKVTSLAHNIRCCFLEYIVIILVYFTPTEFRERVLPRFVVQPPSHIYYLRDKNNGEDSISKLGIQVAVTPKNSTLSVAAAYQGQAERYIYLPILRESPDNRKAHHDEQPFARVVKFLAEPTNESSKNIGLQVWNIIVSHLPTNMVLYLLLSSQLGTVRSRPVFAVPFELPYFPRYADAKLSLLIGNTGRVVCHLPRSRPSLPIVRFLHDGRHLEVDAEGSRYRVVYVGGDGTGTPWVERNSDGMARKPIFEQPLPSAAILFIHPLQLNDGGSYQCEASLMGTKRISEQRTIINVTKPNQQLNARLRFSSDDPELSDINAHFVPTHSSADLTEWIVPEGFKLTLFCLFESAPVVQTRWYFTGDSEDYRQNKNFGILSIDVFSPDNEGTYTCAAKSSGEHLVSKSFKIKVFGRDQLIAHPSNLVDVRRDSDVLLGCSYSKNDLKGINATRKHKHWWEATLTEEIGQRQMMSLEDFQQGTGIGWLCNGKSCSPHLEANKLQIATTPHGTYLRIRNFTGNEQAIYQCWLIKQHEWMTTAISVIENDTEAGQMRIISTSGSIAGLVSERTKEGITGHLNCNVSQILDQTHSNFSREKEWLVLWFRGPESAEPIDILESNARVGGVKYLSSQFGRVSHVLSIMNPSKTEDEGIYTCRVYSPENNELLGQMQFTFSVDTIPEEILDVALPLWQTESVHKTVTHAAQTDLVNTSSEQQIEHTFHPTATDVKIPLCLVTRLAEFSLAVRITWNVSSIFAWSRSWAFTIQYRERKHAKQHNQGLSSRRNAYYEYPASLLWHWSRSLEESEGEWFPIQSINQSFQDYDICLLNPTFFHPGREYSLRVVAILAESKTNKFNNLSSKIYSNWSEKISFADLLNWAPQILSLSSKNSTAFELSWIISLEPYMPVQTQSRWNGNGSLKFSILYHPVNIQEGMQPMWSRCTSMENNLRKWVGLTSQEIDFRETTKHSSKIIIGQLSPNTTYAVAMYGVLFKSQRISAAENEFQTLYSMLSDTVWGETKINENLPETECSETKFRTYLPKSKEFQLKKHATIVYQHGNHVMVVVLGSLAGVLLVICATLMALFCWRQVEKKHMIPQVGLLSPNKGCLTNSPVNNSDSQEGHPLYFEQNDCPLDRSLQTFLAGTNTNIPEICSTFHPVAPQVSWWTPYPRQNGMNLDLLSPWFSVKENSLSSSTSQLSTYCLQSIQQLENQKCKAGILDQPMPGTHPTCERRSSLKTCQAEPTKNDNMEFIYMRKKMFNGENSQNNHEQASSVYSHIGSQSTINESEPISLYQATCPSSRVHCSTTVINSTGYGSNQDKAVDYPLTSHNMSLNFGQTEESTTRSNGMRFRYPFSENNKTDKIVAEMVTNTYSPSCDREIPSCRSFRMVPSPLPTIWSRQTFDTEEELDGFSPSLGGTHSTYLKNQANTRDFRCVIGSLTSEKLKDNCSVLDVPERNSFLTVKSLASNRELGEEPEGLSAQGIPDIFRHGKITPNFGESEADVHIYRKEEHVKKLLRNVMNYPERQGEWFDPRPEESSETPRKLSVELQYKSCENCHRKPSKYCTRSCEIRNEFSRARMKAEPSTPRTQMEDENNKRANGKIASFTSLLKAKRLHTNKNVGVMHTITDLGQEMAV